jgi:sulfur-oxidizing protein SoxY
MAEQDNADSEPGLHGLPDASRRRMLAAGAGMMLWLTIRPATAEPAEMAAAVRSFTGGAKISPGKVRLDVATLVDNGNAVPVTVSVDSPMTAAEYVAAIAIFNERNPLPDVARFTLGPRAGKAAVSTRMRLATSQKLMAVAKLSDGTYWSHTVDVVVTLAACIEGES